MNVMEMISWRKPVNGVRAGEGYIAAQLVIAPPGAKALCECRSWACGDVRREGETEEEQKRRLASLLLRSMAEDVAVA